jgi:uncharacterized membrane protein YphA (DoxX/SURF4 family)
MKYFYLSIFLLGLALAVQVMLHGIERWRLSRSTQPSAVVNPPTFAALAAGFGAGGYLLTTRSGIRPSVIFLLSLVIGVAAHFAMTVLMARWAFRGAAHSPSEDEEINGQVATVTKEISPEGAGEVSWVAYDKTHFLPATALSGSSIPQGTEVVIDVVENGVARVELWSVVESRL